MEAKDAPTPGDAPRSINTTHDLLLETAGRCMAYEFAIKVLIATHTDAKKLAAIWRQRCVELIEAAMESPIYAQSQSYSSGMNTTLGRLAQFLLDEDPENQ